MNLDLIRELEKVNFESQLQLFLTTKLSYEHYDIYLSDYIEDSLWNITTNINYNDIKYLKKDYVNIKNIFNKYNREPVLYFTPSSNLYDKRDNIELEKIYTDSWLLLDNLKDYPEYESILDINIKQVTKGDMEDYIEAISNGFSSEDPDYPYEGLTEGYKQTFRNNILDNKLKKYKNEHYIAKYDDQVVGTMTVNRNNKIAFLYNITTNRNYKKRGICKELISYIVKKLDNENIKYICLLTEKECYTEQIYLKLGFKKIFEADAYKINN